MGSKFYIAHYTTHCCRVVEKKNEGVKGGKGEGECERATLVPGIRGSN